VKAATDARVVVIAATNRPAAVDPALRRPGRSVENFVWSGVQICVRGTLPSSGVCDFMCCVVEGLGLFEMRGWRSVSTQGVLGCMHAH
jgi:hypothetical protein